MTLDLIVQDRAEDDMYEIWYYIAHHNMEAAQKITRRIHSIFAVICDNPFMGRARPEFGEEIRSFPVDEYVIFYRPAPNAIEIIRVLNAALDVDETNIDISIEN